MIISASRRTDLPAYFGRWFIQRILEGYFHSVNPFNPHQIKRVSLLPQDVDVMVFWTKNPRPFFESLNVVDEMGYPYYFLFTLNDYPEQLEPGVPSVPDRLETFKALSARIGRERVVWRYDPIVMSSITPLEFHLQAISMIARSLKGYTDRLVISFLDLYAKVKHRMGTIEAQPGIQFRDIRQDVDNSELHTLTRAIGEIAHENEMTVTTCAEEVSLNSLGIRPGSCIDANLIRRLFHPDRSFPKDQSQRKKCLCAQSIDVGAYNTCSAQCTYCYANASKTTVLKNLQRHFLHSPSLISG